MGKMTVEITWDEKEVTQQRVADAVEQGLSSAAANLAPFDYQITSKLWRSDIVVEGDKWPKS